MNYVKSLGSYFSAAANLFMPRKCVVCGRELGGFEKWLCVYCLADMPLTFFWQRAGNAAEQLFFGRVRIERCCSLFFYRGDFKKCLYSIKYDGNIRLGNYLGTMLGMELAKMERARVLPPVDCLVPVPLHWRKRLMRGYNQSEIICGGILKGLEAAGCSRVQQAAGHSPRICAELIRRVRFTGSQTRRERDERWRNVENAFMIRPSAARKFSSGREIPHVVVVDDVLTTGATIEACAMRLHEAFPCRISVATIAFAGE